MSTRRPHRIADASVGVGLRAAHARELLATRPRLAWLELLSENYMVEGGPPLEVLDGVTAHYPVVLHGVGLYVGDSAGVSSAHLARLARLASRARPAWVSDHLCWGSVDGRFSHDLLPLPFTWEAVRQCVAGIRRVQDTLAVPFLVENVSSYAELAGAEMTEWQFVSEVAERADCGLLVDVNNVFVSATNHGFDARAYVDALPWQRVRQLHLAGHADHGRCLIDTHDRPVAPAVWELYEHVLTRCGPVPTLLEWDARLPDLAGVLAEARKAEPRLQAAEGRRAA